MNKETMKGIVFLCVLLTVAISLVYLFGSPKQSMGRFAIEEGFFPSDDPHFCGEDKVSWIAYVIFEESPPQQLNDSLYLCFDQFSFFAKDHAIYPENFNTVMKSEEGKWGFSFCTPDSIKKEKLVEILKKAL